MRSKTINPVPNARRILGLASAFQSPIQPKHLAQLTIWMISVFISGALAEVDGHGVIQVPRWDIVLIFEFLNGFQGGRNEHPPEIEDYSADSASGGIAGHAIFLG